MMCYERKQLTIHPISFIMIKYISQREEEILLSVLEHMNIAKLFYFQF